MSADELMPRMRDGLELNADVTVTVPAHVLLSFVVSYSAAKWTCPYTTMLLFLARKALYAPAYLKEQEARMQAEEAQVRQIMSRMVPGFPAPDTPPDAGELG